MAENSKIEWCDHTFNPWIGCTKVSPGCTNCYAAVDTFARRERSHGRELWGPHAERHRTAEAYWKKPLAWNKDNWYQCLDCGWRGSHKNTLPHAEWQREICPSCRSFNTEFTRQRVFCSSLADVFEDRPDIFLWRDDLFRLIEQTPNLDWLLLTKRPENVKRSLPSNVWIGTSVENQQYADERIPALLKVPAKVRFLSCEPLLSNIRIQKYLLDGAHKFEQHIHWVICGGESGPHARPMHPDWARSLQDQCQAVGVPFLFKQWGEWMPVAELYADDGPDKAFEYLDHWQVQMEPNGAIPVMTAPIHVKEGGWHEYQPCPGSWFMAKVGKKKAGRLLDGREWNETPLSASTLTSPQMEEHNLGGE
jgi:protein gp37